MNKFIYNLAQSLYSKGATINGSEAVAKALNSAGASKNYEEAAAPSAPSQAPTNRPTTQAKRTHGRYSTHSAEKTETTSGKNNPPRQNPRCHAHRGFFRKFNKGVYFTENHGTLHA